jgi:hypothetical protein
MLLASISGFVALGMIVGPVIADELFGVITKVDVVGKKLTVMQKGEEKETIITVTDDTELVTPKGESKVDLEKLEKGVKKAQEAGKKGMFAKITHEKGVASKIGVVGKKKAEAPVP